MSILDLFQSIAPETPSAVLCMRADSKENVTIMACKSGDKTWQNWAEPISGTNNELYASITRAGWDMATYPVVISGFMYQLFVNLNGDHTPLPRVELSRQLQITAQAHNRTFTVEPQAEVLDLLLSIPDNSATLVTSILFKERKYTILSWRSASSSGVEMLEVDPPAFESALRVSGWRQSQQPIHQTGNKYNVLIEKSEGPRYLITEKTDLQDYKEREESLVAHFWLQHA